MNPRVSVIVPTYNRADLLPATLQSVLGQAFADLELLLVDDGSTDGTEQVVRGIADGRLVYLPQPHSGLPAVARNAGLRRARGAYIAFLDSDDLWLPDKLAVQVEYMDAHPELGLTFANAIMFGGDPEAAKEHQLFLNRPPSHPTHSAGAAGLPSVECSFEELYGWPIIPSLTVMIRAAVVSVVGFFDEDPRLKANEDYDYWLRIAAHCRVAYLDRPLAEYRRHAGGISRATVASCQSKLFLVDKLDRTLPERVARLTGRRRRWLASIHYGLGRGLLRQDRPAEGRRHFSQSLRLSPRLPALLFLAASLVGGPLYRRLDGLKARLRPGR